MSGLRGRPRKPTKLKLVEGNPGKRPLPKDEPNPPAGDPEKPEVVKANKFASAKWDELVRDTTLKNARVLTVADGHWLEKTCLAYALFRLSLQAIDDNDGELTYETIGAGGLPVRKKLPELEVYRAAEAAYATGLAHLGLSPATRAKVSRIDDDQAKKPNDRHFGA